MDAICVFSNFNSQPISMAVIEFLQSEKDDNEKGTLKPLSVHFLYGLYIRCRQRILDLIEQIFFSDKQSEFKSPALVETYARLLQICPGV